MPEYPPAALRAASEAIERELMSGTAHDGHLESDDALAKAALDAAAPLLAEAIAERILAHMEEHWPTQRRTAHPPSRHFRIAAQVAARSFTTEAEMRQQAAEAIARGVFIACDIPEDPGA